MVAVYRINTYINIIIYTYIHVLASPWPCSNYSYIWVFGMVDTSSSPALGVMQVVPSRDAATLLPIIQQYTKPGTEVWSDEWNAYSNVNSLTTVSRHRTVNHSLHFKDPVTGIYPHSIY